MLINSHLIRAIAKSGLDFEDVSIFSGMMPSKLVRIIQGKLKPDKETKRLIAVILNKSVNDLWPVEDRR